MYYIEQINNSNVVNNLLPNKKGMQRLEKEK